MSTKPTLDQIRAALDRVELKRYDTLTALIEQLWQMPAEELQEGQFGGHGEDGQRAGSFSFEEYLASIESMGVYGFAQPEKGQIHYWINGTAPQTTLIHFLAHELCHCVQAVRKRRPTILQEIAEEVLCESHGMVAAKALDLVGSLPPNPSSEKAPSHE